MVNFDWAQTWANYHPDRIALKDWDSGKTLTYGQLNHQGEVAATFLAETYGLGSGDRIAVLAENCTEYVALFSAAQKAGFILAPLNYRLNREELLYVVENAAPKVVLVQEKFASLWDEEMATATRTAWLAIETFSAVLERPLKTGFSRPRPHLTPGHPVFILYTSGTTGYPKGALYTHEMMFWNSVNTAMRLDLTSTDRTLNFMPPFHTGGWNVLLTPFLHHGGYTCLMRQFDAGEVLKALDEERCTLFMGVPTMLKMLAEHPEFSGADFSSLRFCIVGGEPMPVPLIETWHQRGVYIRQGFGMTEAGPNLFSLHQDDAVRKAGSIGKPNFYVQVRIVDEEGNDVATGEAGELLIRGEIVTPGYWENAEATHLAFSGPWLRTGDLLRQDEEGYFYVQDRLKNMFISGGENVYPAEIERVLVLHRAVKEVAVIGVPHEKWGESGCAFVSLKPGTTTTGAELAAFCQEKLARFKTPKSFVFLPDLPKNATGKIDRQALKKNYSLSNV